MNAGPQVDRLERRNVETPEQLETAVCLARTRYLLLNVDPDGSSNSGLTPNCPSISIYFPCLNIRV